ncbi:uncharacterized protein [Elaeis guineensis]|uniref:Uncharacterized protein LOC105060128 n=1 Tax=Elaeis guineensis var. tenera TaxID=51953 RepID=A0A6I9SEJ5_ELAGV|nr:uncharacterized protein LOC105060128 [Elaeis guineensis]
MGNCASSKSKSLERWDRRPAAAKVIHLDGSLEEYQGTVRAGQVVARNPGYYVCAGEAMEVGDHPQEVAEAEELQPGQLYFLLPVSSSRHPLSLPDLCLLAIRASAALRRSPQVAPPPCSSAGGISKNDMLITKNSGSCKEND